MNSNRLTSVALCAGLACSIAPLALAVPPCQGREESGYYAQAEMSMSVDLLDPGAVDCANSGSSYASALAWGNVQLRNQYAANPCNGVPGRCCDLVDYFRDETDEDSDSVFANACQAIGVLVSTIGPSNSIPRSWAGAGASVAGIQAAVVGEAASWSGEICCSECLVCDSFSVGNYQNQWSSRQNARAGASYRLTRPTSIRVTIRSSISIIRAARQGPGLPFLLPSRPFVRPGAQLLEVHHLKHAPANAPLNTPARDFVVAFLSDGNVIRLGDAARPEFVLTPFDLNTPVSTAQLVGESAQDLDAPEGDFSLESLSDAPSDFGDLDRDGSVACTDRALLAARLGLVVNTVGYTVRADFDLDGDIDDADLLAFNTRFCIADVDDGSATGTLDGGVTIDDLLHFLSLFEHGNLCADVDDGSASGRPDGGVTIDDLLHFLLRFESGC